MKMKLYSSLFGGEIWSAHQAYNLSDVSPNVYPGKVIKKDYNIFIAYPTFLDTENFQYCNLKQEINT